MVKTVTIMTDILFILIEDDYYEVVYLIYKIIDDYIS